MSGDGVRAPRTSATVQVDTQGVSTGANHAKLHRSPARQADRIRNDIDVKSRSHVDYAMKMYRRNGGVHLLLIFIPPRGGFKGCLLPSAKDVVLGRPLISSAATFFSQTYHISC